MTLHRRHPVVASSGLMLAACLFAGGLAVVPSVGAGAATTLGAAATFSGPVTVGHVIEPISVHPSGIAAHGYVEQEFFASGTARAFHSNSMPSDGKWKITASSTAPYRTRILVRRPSNPARFSGTVVVEWMNVTAGESAPDWDFANPALMEAGDAWVGVSVQAVAVEGGTPLLGSPAGGGSNGLVQQEPARYGTLHHPGDRFALDIFEQVGLGLRAPHGAHVFGPLHPRHIVAAGESQSAFYLTTYADALQPLSHAYDGIFIHSRDGSGAPLDSNSLTSGSLAGGLRIRTDLAVPVFMFETQTDVTFLGYASAQQPDTRDIRTWEVAGTSHADSYVVGPYAGALGCGSEINTGPQHVVVQAALQDFVKWVVHGTPPPSPSLFSVERKPSTLARDSHGNVIGGVRTPAVDVPVSTLSEVAPAGSSVICTLFGSTTAFGPSTLAALYGSKASYVAKYSADLDRAIAKRYLLPSERASLLAQANQVQFPAG
jgi:Alpha/beta hydrolase domain